MRKKKAIVAGHICLDITPVFSGDTSMKGCQAGTEETGSRMVNIGDVLQPGKLIQMDVADVHTGGAVANTGLAMKLLGAEVSLMGKIGRDPFGDMVMNILQKYDAERGMICLEQESTSYSVVLAMPGIDRIFLHHPGANHTFAAEDISEEQLEAASLFHFGYPPLMRKMYENQGKELTALFQKAKAKECATSLDFAAMDAKSEAGQIDWKLILEKTLPYVDFFVPSVEELCFMLDRAKYYELLTRAKGRDITEILDIDTDVKPLADWCMAHGTKVLMIKCGAPGIYYRTADVGQLTELSHILELHTEEWADREGFEASYVPERILSGTGAGDTSIAAFLTSGMKGYSLDVALQMATATGTSCVAAYDALSGLKSLEELQRKIDAGWKKNV